MVFERVFQGMDTDDDRHITLEEFATYLRYAAEDLAPGGPSSDEHLLEEVDRRIVDAVTLNTASLLRSAGQLGSRLEELEDSHEDLRAALSAASTPEVDGRLEALQAGVSALKRERHDTEEREFLRNEAMDRRLDHSQDLYSGLLSGQGAIQQKLVEMCDRVLSTECVQLRQDNAELLQRWRDSDALVQQLGRSQQTQDHQIAALQQQMSVLLALQADKPSAKERLLELIFRGGNLSGLDFREADLSGIHFAGSNLFHIDLTGAILSGCELSGCDLRGARMSTGQLLSASSIAKCNLSGWNLSNVQLNGRDLSGCTFTDCTLTGADLAGARMAGAKLGQAKGLTGQQLASAADLSGADLRGRDLSNCDLSNSMMTDAVLTNANLSHCNLSGCDLSGCDLRGANLSGSTVQRARLRGALMAAPATQLGGATGQPADTGWEGLQKGVRVLTTEDVGIRGRWGDVSPVRAPYNSPQQRPGQRPTTSSPSPNKLPGGTTSPLNLPAVLQHTPTSTAAADAHDQPTLVIRTGVAIMNPGAAPFREIRVRWDDNGVESGPIKASTCVVLGM